MRVMSEGLRVQMWCKAEEKSASACEIFLWKKGILQLVVRGFVLGIAT